MVVETAQAVPAEGKFIAVVSAWLNGCIRTFALFLAFGSAVLLFAFLTVYANQAEALYTQSGAARSRATILYWQQHGYFHCGGLIHLAAPNPSGTFWRSSTGIYMLSGYIVERIAMAGGSRYRPAALAVHNEIVVLLTASLFSLLLFRLLRRLGLDAVTSAALSAAAELVVLSFPGSLWQYWEITPQGMALPFAILFILFDAHQLIRRHDVILQGFFAFALVYMESVYGVFLLAAYLLLRVFIDERPLAWRRLLSVTLLPAIAALILFSVQVMVNRSNFPSVPLGGSGFMMRTGLDGAAEYYGEHSDLIYGRAVARSNFPVNRQYLFTWQWLFIAGCLASAIMIALAVRKSAARPLLVAIGSLTGAYVFYASFFSEAVVIHPYQYDYLLAVPLIGSVFAIVPAIAEVSFRMKGIAATLVIFAACWYAMVQMRNYALWYPAVPTPLAPAQMATVGKEWPAEWVTVPYSAGMLATDKGTVSVSNPSQLSVRYTVVGKVMLLSVNLQSLSVSGAPREIHVVIPDGHIAAGFSTAPAIVDNNSAYIVTRCYTQPAYRYVAVLADLNGTTTFTNCSHCVYIQLTTVLDIQ